LKHKLNFCSQIHKFSIKFYIYVQNDSSDIWLIYYFRSCIFVQWTLLTKNISEYLKFIRFMRNYLKIAILLSIVMFSFVRCSNEKDSYFDRPSWLEPPIYQVLEKQGKFTNYLKCVDKTLYAGTLKASGLYTVFAPNDEAFKKYLSAKGYASVSDMPDSLANQIVSYSIVYNNYSFDRLTDVLSGGWDTLTSIKKKTAYYETIHQENYMGKNIWVWDIPASTFNLADQNYKYIPFYLSRNFESNRTAAQAAEDYGCFYSTPYTGNNVQSASIITKDMKAENGVAHEVDQVLEPLPTLEKLIKDPDYSEFNKLVNIKGSTGSPYFISYMFNQTVTDKWAKAMPSKNITEVYMKIYGSLAINLNSEKYGTTDKQAEQGGYTLFAPSNTAVTKFYEDKLKTYYPDGIDKAPADVIYYFLNAQMSSDLIWAKDFKSSMNVWGEYLNGKGPTGDNFNKGNYKKIVPASNGLFYGSDNYIKSKYFETVFTEILLNPRYNMLNHAFTEYYSSSLKEELLRCELNGYTQENYTILLPSDAQLAADGFSWIWLAGSNKYGFANTQAASTLGSFDVATRIQRLVRSHVFKRIKNSDVNSAITNFSTDPSFAAAYGGYSYAVNDYGDMIRYKDGKIQMVGNYDENDWVTATPYKTFMNGQVFTIDKMLQYSRRNTLPNTPTGYTTQDLLVYIKSMAVTNPNVSKFVSYITASMNTINNDLLGLNNDMILTIFMPTNTEIDKAVTNGDLPTLATISTDITSKNKAVRFIMYHIVKDKQFVDDGLKYIMPNTEKVTEEVRSTVLKDVVDNTYLAISKDGNGYINVSTKALSTGKNLSNSVKTAKVVRGLTRSNFFGGRAVLHEIDSYFVYQRVQ